MPLPLHPTQHGSTCPPLLRAIIAPTVPPNRLSPIGVQLRSPFRIYRVQSDGDLHFVEAVQTFEGAKARVRELGKLWPGKYVIENQETGKRVFVNTRDETKN